VKVYTVLPWKGAFGTGWVSLVWKTWTYGPRSRVFYFHTGSDQEVLYGTQWEGRLCYTKSHAKLHL